MLLGMQTTMSLQIQLMRKKNEENSFVESTIDFINQDLYSLDLPVYTHPVDFNLHEVELPYINWSYSKFASLRRFVLKIKEGISLEPDDVFDHPEIQAELMDKYVRNGESHLFSHCDFDGYFVPVEFGNRELPNAFLFNIGSSLRLNIELLEVAEKINLNLGSYTSNFTLLYDQRIDEIENDLLGVEKFHLLCLYNLSLASIMYNLVIIIS